MAPPPSLVGTADASDYDSSATVSAPKLTVSLPDHALKGIGLIIASTLFFSASDVLAKMMTATMPFRAWSGRETVSLGAETVAELS